MKKKIVTSRDQHMEMTRLGLFYDYFSYNWKQN